MDRRVNIAACIVVVILGGIITEGASYKNYGKILENGDFEENIELLGPRSLFNTRFRNVTQQTLSYTCGRDIAVLNQAILRRETWALKMIDASSKIPSGIYEGNIIDMGMYDECMGIRGRSLSYDIRGRHCMYSIGLTNGNTSSPINPTLSICVPSNCTAQDIADLFNGTINAIDKLKNLGITVSSISCSTIDPIIWDTEFIVCLVILVIFVGFLVICSVCDGIHSISEPGAYRHPVLLGLGKFSLQRNAAAILSVQEKEGNLPAIHGIRFLSIAWVVLGHEHVTQIFGVNVNMVDIFEWVQSWQSLYIFIAPFAVDTFFVMSGFLMSYLFFKQMPRHRSFNVPMYYIHRYIRLTPAVIALIVISIVFIPKAGSGARWYFAQSFFLGQCRDDWWSRILYIQNFVDKDNMCLGHLWYLAVDMQLFWISPIILYPLYKKPKIGLAILASLLVASLIVPASIVGINQYPAISFTHETNATIALDVFKNVYEMPYNRAAPWLIGILVGFEVANKNRRLSKKAVWAGWMVALGSFAFCTFGTRSFLDPSYEYNIYWETFFTTVSRPIWAVGICWIIYATIYGHAGIVTSILSWKVFLPLSRLSYCLYLVHMIVQIMFVASIRTPSYFSSLNIWRVFLSDLTISLVAAFFFSLLFESPVLVIEKLLFRRKREVQYESQKDLRPNDEEEARDEENIE